MICESGEDGPVLESRVGQHDELAAQPIEVERPNITASLRQVRLLRARLLGEEAGRAKAAAERAEASVPAAAIEPASMEPAR